MAAYVLLWLLSLLSGFALVYAIWPHDISWRGMMLRLALGVGPGVGTTSVLFFLGRATGIDPPVGAYLAVLALLTLLLLILAAWRGGWKVDLQLQQLPNEPGRWLWLGVLILTVILTTNGFLGRAVVNPVGEFDAMSEVELARPIPVSIRAGLEGYVRPWDEFLNHPDYPLLIPGMIAISWRALGHDLGHGSGLAPVSTALVFTLATAGLLFSALNYQRKFIAACLATWVALLSGSVLRVGALQYADIPLAYMILGAVVCIYLFLKEERSAWLVLGGVFCGLSTWTKNEGWSLVVAVLLSLLLVLWVQRRPLRESTGRICLFLAGGLPWILVTLYYKLTFKVPNEFFVSRTVTNVLTDLLDVSRWMHAIERAVSQINLQDGRIFILLVLVALVTGTVKQHRLSAAAGFLVVGLVGLQYLTIFVISPYDMDWHMDTALPRLAVHLYPAALFLIFTRLDLGKRKVPAHPATDLKDSLAVRQVYHVAE